MSIGAQRVDFGGGQLVGPTKPPGDKFVDETVDLTVKPVPRPSVVSAPYWEACRRHELIVQRCAECEGYTFSPAAACKHCGARALEWVKSAGSGTIYSYSVVHRAPLPAFDDDVPYVVAVIRLAEGFEMLSNVIDCDPDELFCEMPVQVVFDDVTPECTLPKFHPLLPVTGSDNASFPDRASGSFSR